MWGNSGAAGVPVIIDDGAGHTLHDLFELVLDAYPVNIFLDKEELFSTFQILLHFVPILIILLQIFPFFLVHYSRVNNETSCKKIELFFHLWEFQFRLNKMGILYQFSFQKNI